MIKLSFFVVKNRDGDKVIHNRSEGYLLRTKAARHNDGGVAAGVAVLDSLYLN